MQQGTTTGSEAITTSGWLSFGHFTCLEIHWRSNQNDAFASATSVLPCVGIHVFHALRFCSLQPLNFFWGALVLCFLFTFFWNDRACQIEALKWYFGSRYWNMEDPPIERTTSRGDGRDEEVLAEFGYKQELKRDWGLTHNFGISFSIIVGL
jgi:hypothetical protein